MAVRLSKEEFIKKSKEIWGDKYDYSLVEYKTSKTKVSIICPNHGIFKQRPDVHLHSACKICSDDRKRGNINIFLEKATNIHGDKYDYSKVIYVSYNHNIEIGCHIHGIFKQTPHNHLKGTGCPKCNGGILYDRDDFIKKANIIHNYKYLYNNCTYEKANKRVIITCLEHGDFRQLPYNHIMGRGCPKCGNKYGKLENKWLDIYNISEEYRQYKINGLFVDGYDPKTNTIFEFYGDFFHGNPKIYNPKDINPVSKKSYGNLYNKTIERERVLKSLGYNIISIWEDDYKKIYKK